MSKTDFASLIEDIQHYRDMQLSEGKSAFIKIKLGKEELERLIVELSKILQKDTILPIFRIDGSDPNASFNSIKQSPQIVTLPNGREATERKLIFPEDQSIILFIRSFNHLRSRDQVEFAGIEEIGEHEKTLFKFPKGSIIIAEIEQSGHIDPSASSRGIYLGTYESS